MSRTTGPTLVQFSLISFGSTTSPISTSSFTWQAGDVFVALMQSANSNAFSTPTATGLTFTAKQNNSTNAASWVGSAIAGSSSSGTVSITDNGSPHLWGAGVWQFRGSDGIGTSFLKNNGGSATGSQISVAPTDAFSWYCWGCTDFFPGTVGSSVLTPTPTNTRDAGHQYANTASYDAWCGDWASGGGMAATSFGITSGDTSTGPFGTVGIEVLGTGDAKPFVVFLPRAVGPPNRKPLQMWAAWDLQKPNLVQPATAAAKSLIVPSRTQRNTLLRM